MKATKFLFLVLILVMALSFSGLIGCGDDDDDDSSQTPVDDDDDDTTDDDDDTTDDDDDTTDDDDDTTDDDDDDDTVDTEYDALTCELSDPESLGAGVMVGGGAIASEIKVYVFDDGDCAPVVGATVAHGGATYTTDVNGMATVTLSKADELVFAYAEDYIGWAYEADAAVMYFRLRPSDYGLSYTDSADGEFTMGGSALGLTNPGLAGLFSNPLNLGVALPGISRETLLSTDFDGLLATGTFDLDMDGTPTPLPNNVYLPSLNLSIPGLLSVSGANESYAFPVEDTATEMSTEGFTIGVSVGEAVPGIADILTIVTCVTGAADINEILACVDDLFEPILNDALDFAYVGSVPDWDTTGNPDIEVVETGMETTVTVANRDAAADYIAALVAEVPNRALLPLGLGLVTDSDEAPVDYAAVPDADYMAALVKTDLLASGFTSANLSFAMKYAEDMSGWGTEVAFDDADFLPNFDGANTSYDDAGTVEWALESKVDVDAYYVVYIPDDSGCPDIVAALPGTATSFSVPADVCAAPSADDIVIVAGISGADLTNPFGVLAQDATAVNLWLNIDIVALLGGLF